MSESGKVVVTKSKLDGLANAINDKAKSPGPKTIAQLTQTVNDMKTDAPVTSVNGKTGAVALSATDVSAIPSTLTGTYGQVLTKTFNGQEWKDATPRDVYFDVNGVLQSQDLQILDIATLSALTRDWNQLAVLGAGDSRDVNIPMPCIDVQYNADSNNTIILRYAGMGVTEELAIFSGIYYDAGDVLQYSVSLVYRLGEQGFEEYNIIPIRVLPNVTTADNGKFLRVVNGAWAAVEIANANGGSF